MIFGNDLRWLFHPFSNLMVDLFEFRKYGAVILVLPFECQYAGEQIDEVADATA
ncbi:MAG: hypothetical protein V7739_21575 [Motiliproteus sp.]